MSKQVLKLFADIFPIYGKSRSVIFDLTRNKFDFIPNSLYQFIESFEGMSKIEILNEFDENEKQIIKEYLTFLESKDYIFWCDESDVDLYPKLALNWDYPAKISNAIIELSHKINKTDLQKVLNELENLGCKHIHFFSDNTIDIELIRFINAYLNNSSYLSLEFIIKMSAQFVSTDYLNLLDKYPRIKAFVFYGAEEEKLYTSETTIGALGNLLVTIKQPQMQLKDREFGNFSVNMEIFTEAQKHNLYFNRKVAIDSDGNIKNHLRAQKIFGNIEKDNLEEIISQKEFQKLWFINKTQIKVCKDCEFRFVCVDDRFDLIKDGEFYEFNSECQYNPYIAKHNKQDSYITVEEWQKQQVVKVEN